MRTKNLNVFELVDRLWDSILDKGHRPSPSDTWITFAQKQIQKNENADIYLIDRAIHIFKFEMKYLYKKPIRKTVKYMFGNHVMLFDTYGCYEHKLTMTTHDDERYNASLSVFCPYCNIKNLKTTTYEFTDMGKTSLEDYSKEIELKKHDEKSWNIVLKHKAFNDKWNRKENFKYFLNNITNFQYLKYKVSSIVKSLFY